RARMLPEPGRADEAACAARAPELAIARAPVPDVEDHDHELAIDEFTDPPVVSDPVTPESGVVPAQSCAAGTRVFEVGHGVEGLEDPAPSLRSEERRVGEECRP